MGSRLTLFTYVDPALIRHMCPHSRDACQAMGYIHDDRVGMESIKDNIYHCQPSLMELI